MVIEHLKIGDRVWYLWPCGRGLMHQEPVEVLKIGYFKVKVQCGGGKARWVMPKSLCQTGG